MFNDPDRTMNPIDYRESSFHNLSANNNAKGSSRKDSRASATGGRERKGSYVDFLDEQNHATEMV